PTTSSWSACAPTATCAWSHATTDLPTWGTWSPGPPGALFVRRVRARAPGPAGAARARRGRPGAGAAGGPGPSAGRRVAEGRGAGPGAPWKAGRGRRGGARPVGASRRSGGTWWRVRRVPSAVHRAAGGRPAPRGKLLKSRPPTERPAVNAIPDPVAAPEVRTAEDRILAALLSRQQLKDVDLARARRLQEET